MKPITESHIEQSAIETLQAQGWANVNGKEMGISAKVISLSLPTTNQGSHDNRSN
ncbi:MAG: hypothetical protein K9J37_02450 [Saprospiraceae bacterium]|nr:hypothetical protein [Saprospiraceae bacterium]MCF8248740.1 hypothetical protein [Saprospiraceae bacterium]MCF8278770.1 hypothetical protein [Bacteroidales bacterium]MCF8310570.1 hypothetical protein [Saprospiraceae bacterium]MCF8439129.1 hypothetical protein [Saprospiraceae bacterium]